MKITVPGIYRDFPTADYFADPCEEPSLSQSIAKVLIEQSPLHAYYAHPILSEGVADDDDDGEKYVKAMAIGNAAHSIMLGRGKVLEVGEYDSWRTKAAQAFKEEAIAAGKEPILHKHHVTAMNMVESAIQQLNRIHGCKNAFTYGDAEVVIASCSGLWLRAMVDWITPDLREIWDYKTSGMSASPYNAGKQMASGGWHIQAAMHERILDDIDPKGAGRRRHYFVCQENEPPYALTVNEIGEAAMTIGRKQIDYAVRMWGHCLAKSEWPGYPLRIIQPELPVWAESGWLLREEKELDEDEGHVKDRLNSLMGG